MRNFTLRKGFLGSKCGTRSSFKGFIMLVVLMLMMASSAMAQEAKFEVIGGLRYLLDTGAKTATLMPKTDGKYSGDIVVPEKLIVVMEWSMLLLHSRKGVSMIAVV